MSGASLFRNPPARPTGLAGPTRSSSCNRCRPVRLHRARGRLLRLVVFNASPDAPSGSYTVRIDNTASSAPQVADGKARHHLPEPLPAGSPITLRAAAEGTPVHVEIYNVQGQMVRALPDAPVGKAGRQVAWDGRNDQGATSGSGIYFLRARIGAGNVNKNDPADEVANPQFERAAPGGERGMQPTLPFGVVESRDQSRLPDRQRQHGPDRDGLGRRPPVPRGKLVHLHEPHHPELRRRRRRPGVGSRPSPILPSFPPATQMPARDLTGSGRASPRQAP